MFAAMPFYDEHRHGEPGRAEFFTVAFAGLIGVLLILGFVLGALG